MMMANPNKFITTTDFPIPTLVFYNTYHFHVPSSQAFQLKSFPHGLPFTPLVSGQWSTNANFEPAYDLALAVPNPGTNEVLFTGADATNINFLPQNAYGGQDFYVRLMAFAPPDYNGPVPELFDNTKFRFNTDYNYPKLLSAGVGNANMFGATIHHGLGYVPLCKVWTAYNSNTGIQPARWDRSWDGTVSGPEVNTEDLVMRATGDFCYHIYAEEA